MEWENKVLKRGGMLDKVVGAKKKKMGGRGEMWLPYELCFPSHANQKLIEVWSWFHFCGGMEVESTLI